MTADLLSGKPSEGGLFTNIDKKMGLKRICLSFFGHWDLIAGREFTIMQIKGIIVNQKGDKKR